MAEFEEGNGMNIDFNKKGWAMREIRRFMDSMYRMLLPKPEPKPLNEQAVEQTKAIAEGKK